MLGFAAQVRVLDFVQCVMEAPGRFWSKGITCKFIVVIVKVTLWLWWRVDCAAGLLVELSLSQMYEVMLFKTIQLRLVSHFPRDFALGDVHAASWVAFCIILIAFSVRGGPPQVFTYSSDFLVSLCLLTDRHATGYNLCLAESMHFSSL